ncbi:MAG: polyprenyl synthetase family protein [Streptococcaceae bacterium]|jgi:geranylgeranyl diphosphate synthase type II|nr:polyprenyl synthetase family protein [Streptococcaceae bacterium]
MEQTLTDFQNHCRPLIDKTLFKLVEKLKAPKLLKKAMLYSLTTGGKRIRPLLTLAVLTSFKREIDEEILKMASAIELVHTYSLIHDDLPVMDNDDFRRGKLTNHKVYGERVAILAGDALLTLAFQVLTQNTPDEKLGFKLVKSLAKAAGAPGMVSGQVLDIQGEGQNLPLAKMQKMHRLKTGALFSYAVKAGLLLTQFLEQKQDKVITKKIAEHFLTYAESFGLAFQICDDILDITQTTEKLGKTAGKDIAMKKSTYPLLLGLTEAKEALGQEITKASAAIASVEKIQPTFNGELLQQFVYTLKVEVS